MISSFSAGFDAIRKRPGLVGLLYLVNLCVAFTLTVPVYIAFNNTVGPSGFSGDLAHAFDLVLWTDIMEKAGNTMIAMGGQLLWMIPLYLVWKAAISVGLVHAIRNGGVRPFWQGVGQFTGRGLLLGLYFLLILLAWTGITAVGTVVLRMLWDSEAGTFWIFFAILPAIYVTGAALIDLMHDYARIALVVENKPAGRALLAGIAWPVRQGVSFALYAAWFFIGTAVLIAPTVSSMTIVGIWGPFLIQQVFLLLRAAVTVGWFGSEVHFFETRRESPLIASTEADLPLGDVPEIGVA